VNSCLIQTMLDSGIWLNTMVPGNRVKSLTIKLLNLPRLLQLRSVLMSKLERHFSILRLPMLFWDLARRIERNC